MTAVISLLALVPWLLAPETLPREAEPAG